MCSAARRACRTACLLLAAWTARGQSTQALVVGRLTDSLTGLPVGRAVVSFTGAANQAAGEVKTGISGFYALPPLSPGVYRIRVAHPGYQAREAHELDLPVAGLIELDFRLRPLSELPDVRSYRSVLFPDRDVVLPFYGPDVEIRMGALEAPRPGAGALESAISDVIDLSRLRDLPLAGRDVYTMLVMQPGVSVDAATSRGLGLSVNGQRPSSANFLLDGVEANNSLVSGPLVAATPESIQEYRISVSNFSAEYGGASGAIANAVTRAGGDKWHGTAYWNQKNDALNGNDFQNNRRGLPRSPLKESQSGYQAGGPLRGNSVFLSSAFERLRSRGRSETVDVTIPTASLIGITAPDSIARRLLQQFPAPASAADGRLTSVWSVAPPVSVDRSSVSSRLDVRRGPHRFMARIASAWLSRPDFIWSPYPDFVSGLREPSVNAALTAISSPRPDVNNEFRFAWSRDDLGWDRAHPEIPTLVDSSPEGVALPGSPAFYAFRNDGRTLELGDHAMWSNGRHIVMAGGGLLRRSSSGYLAAGRDGRYQFPTVVDFAADRPSSFSVAVTRSALPGLAAPDFDRRYDYSEASAFLQDSYRATQRLSLNFGVRIEKPGTPRNTGAAKDAVVRLGPGSNFAERLQSARLEFSSAGDQVLYRPGAADWAIRSGFAFDALGNGRTVVRGGYGIFHDRPFDNLWRSASDNGFVLATFTYAASSEGYLAPVGSILPAYAGQPVETGFPRLTMFQQDWKTAYSQNFFLAVRHQFSTAWSLETAGVGALGRSLVTTDEVNRAFSVGAGAAGPGNPDRSYNPNLPAIAYRGAQGCSDYSAFTALVRRRHPLRLFQLAYTWSHSIDNQSDPIAGDFFNLDFTRPAAAASTGAAAFTRQFDSRIDRGDSDFDQRHNLVFYSIWRTPSTSRFGGLLRGWTFAQAAAFRSGLPYTVLGFSSVPAQGGVLLNNRADMVLPAGGAQNTPAAAEGGERLLDPRNFAEPEAGHVGNTGRNAFRGPGFYSLDVSLGRTFAAPWLGESGRLTIRADAFNALNHANLNSPDSTLGSPTFGIALYGRHGRESGFPALVPFHETARQVQLILRLEF